VRNPIRHHGFDPSQREQDFVSTEQLQTLLESLELGEAEFLSRRQFDQVFAGAASTADEQKLAAAELAESKGCGVLFTGQDGIYAIFRRRQRRGELRLREA
jgi:hypothetical protein